MMQQQNQQFSQQPPQVVTTKDLSYLQDAMSWELVAMKKCSEFANQCTDQKVKQAIDKAGRMHKQHFQKLLNHLDSGAGNQIMQ